MDVPGDRPAETSVSIVVFTLGAGIAIKPMPQAGPWLAPPDKARPRILAFSHSPSVEAALQAVSRRRQ